MGLEAVELVMAVEEAFDIRLEDDEAMQARTPRDLIELVWRKVEHADANGCLTQRAFNRLRAALLRTFLLKRRDITPAAWLDDLVPKPQRDLLRAQLADELGTGPLPGLVRPPWIVAVLTTACIAVGLGVLVALLLSFPSLGLGMAGLAGAMVAALAGMLVSLATYGLRTAFPPGIATVGDLSRWTITHHAGPAAPASSRWTREQVSARIREIVIEQLNCAAAYREDARFIDDLGLS